MILWVWILVWVILAALAAFGWHWIAVDPGRVLIELRGWEIHTTVLTAAVIVVVAAVIVFWLWRAAHWPFGATGRHQRRVARENLTSGLVYLAEGHHEAAQRTLQRAARYAPQKGVALLAAARAAAARGDAAGALDLLAKAAKVVPLAALSARARLARHDGRAGEALALLVPAAKVHRLAPAGWLEMVECALAAGDPAQALAALGPLRKSAALGPDALAAIEVRVDVAAIKACTDDAALKKLWSSLGKARRRHPEVVAAYALRASRFGQSMAAMGEVEAALNRQWSALLVETWGALEDADIEVRLSRAESWLDKHPGDAVLLSVMGRLCARLEIWGKAREYLGRALAAAPRARTWEALGEVYAGQGNVLMSQRCYRNALRLERGEPVEPLPGMQDAPSGGDTPVDDRRDSLGLPHVDAR